MGEAVSHSTEWKHFNVSKIGRLLDFADVENVVEIIGKRDYQLGDKFRDTHYKHVQGLFEFWISIASNDV